MSSPVQNRPIPQTSDEYSVRLDAFEGPLDLLLFLIRRAEVEITDIPIAEITRQYLAYLEQFSLDDRQARRGSALDIDDAGEFLVMAATLMEIKSRMLRPVAPARAESAASGAGDAAGPDPRAELVQQLLEYKRYRDAANQLDTIRRDWEDRFPTGRALAPKTERPVDDDDKVEVAELSLVDLVEAFSRIVETVDLSRVGEHHVLMDDTPVELHAEDIVFRLRERAEQSAARSGAGSRLSPGEMDFREIFAGRSRSDMIGLFLAVLELVKQQRLSVRQELVADTATPGTGLIVVKLVETGDAADSSARSSDETATPALPKP
jgi:segregation and condensation protein A